MPYYLGSNRDIDAGRRTMVGVGGRLKSRSDEDETNKGTKIAYSSRATIDLGEDGELKVHVWVLDKDVLAQVPTQPRPSWMPTAPSWCAVTAQRTGSEKREWIKRVWKTGTPSPA